jgi:uncharacterized membrane protein
MTTLTVWKCNSASGAEEALAKLSDRQKERLIEIQDAAMVVFTKIFFNKS